MKYIWFTAALIIADIYCFAPCHHLHVLILPFFISFFFSCHGSCTQPVQPVLALTCNSFHTLARRNRLNFAYITRQRHNALFFSAHCPTQWTINEHLQALTGLTLTITGLYTCLWSSQSARWRCLSSGACWGFPKISHFEHFTADRSPPCRLRMMLTPEEQVVSHLKEQCVKIDHPYNPNPYYCYD